VRIVVGFVLLAASVFGQDARPLDAFLRGEVRSVRGNRVTVHYDFKDKEQFGDFELRAPDGLLPKDAKPAAEIENGQLVVQRHTVVSSRLPGRGAFRAVFKWKPGMRRDCGFLLDGGGKFLLFDLYDNRFRAHGGLFTGFFTTGAPLKWRSITYAMPQAAGRFFGFDKVAETEMTYRGTRTGLRVESFHQHRDISANTTPLKTFRFGIWAGPGPVMVDELTLELELTLGLLAEHKLVAELREDEALRGRTEKQLAAMAKDRPLSARAAGARRELGRRGEDGWKLLYKLVRHFGRKQAYAAIPSVRTLGDGNEPERRADLLALAKTKSYDPNLKLAIAIALLSWYPQDEKLIHKALRLPVRGRRELLRALIDRDAPDAVFKTLTGDPELTEEVFALLKDRGTKLSLKDLGTLPRVRAREALSPAAARAILEEFEEEPNWALVSGLIALLKDEDKQVARGAYLLLLTLGGKDIAPDPDLWHSWISAKKDEYKAPPISSQGAATAAIMRGVEFLKKDLLEDGAAVWPMSPDWPGTRVGATALVVYALRAAGVPKTDPAIRKAVGTTLLSTQSGIAGLRSDLDRYTYALSLLALALHAVDPQKYADELKTVAKRLSEGQLENGQWTYRCHPQSHYASEARRPKAGDNSNTQYAILALRACRLAGAEVLPEVWKKNAAFWIKSRNSWGGWGYGPRGSTDHELSMTAAGVATFAICMEGLHGMEAFEKVKNSERVNLGMQRLGEILLVKGYKDSEIYALYGIERAAILTGTRVFANQGKEFDWYHEGASQLVAGQKESGAWGEPDARGVASGAGYGEAIDTAYALLFLKRATTGLPGSGAAGFVNVKYVRPQTVK
jgi:hypothetical protein